MNDVLKSFTAALLMVFSLLPVRMVFSAEPATSSNAESLQARFRLGFALDVNHVRVPKLQTLKDLADALAAFGYTEFQLMLKDDFDYEGYPEITAGWSPITAAEIRELDAYCFKRGIVLTPNQSPLGYLEKFAATDPRRIDIQNEISDEFWPLFSHANRRHLDSAAISDGVSGTFFGCFRQVRTNVDRVVAAGRKYGASGLLLTSWGDGGHRAPWIMSLPALAYAAAKVRGEEMTDDQVAAAIDKVIGSPIGAALVALSNVTEPEQPTVTEAKPDAAYAAALRTALAKCDRASLKPNLLSGYDMLALGVDIVSARADGSFDAKAAAFGTRFAKAWLADSRAGGLREAMTREVRLTVPTDLDALADDGAVGPVLTLTAKNAAEWKSFLPLSQYSAVVLDGRLGISNEAALALAETIVKYVRAGGGLAWIKPYYSEFDGADYFLQLAAGFSRGTPWKADGTWRFVNERPRHPLNAAFRDEPASFTRQAEIPLLSSFYARERCNVLVSMDLADEATRRAERAYFAAKGSGEARLDGDYAVSWTTREQKGRAFCTLFGADDPVLKRHIADGIRFARGLVDEKGPRVPPVVAWRSSCRLDWANGKWNAALAEKAKAARGKHFEVVAFGDSITEFWGSAKDSPQKGGKEVWEGAFGPFGTRAQIFGMAGDRSENILWRVTEGGEADGWTAKVITLMCGINNLMCLRTQGAKPDRPADVVRGYTAIVRALRRRHPESKIVVFGTFPTLFKETESWVNEVNARLAQVKWGENVVYRNINRRFRTDDGKVDAKLYRNGAHPNYLGYARWLEEIKKEL